MVPKQLALALLSAVWLGEARSADLVAPSNAEKIVTFAELRLKGPGRYCGRLPRDLDDNGYYRDFAVVAFPTNAEGSCIAKTNVIEITRNLKANGTLEWTVPDGVWSVLRFGCKCSGERTLPESAFGGGLEPDKLSPLGTDCYFAQVITNQLIESCELGLQNWSDGLEQAFENWNGYSLIAYLPVFAGRVIGSAEETARFREDFRRVLADEYAINHIQELARKCHECGLKFALKRSGDPNVDFLQCAELSDLVIGTSTNRQFDVLFYAGSAIPCQYDEEELRVPAGYSRSVCSKRMLLQLEVDGGKLVSPRGCAYSLLAIPPLEAIGEDELIKLERLLRHGAKICGKVRPKRAPGLAGYPTSDEKIAALVDRVWAKGVLGLTPAEALAAH